MARTWLVEEHDDQIPASLCLTICGIEIFSRPVSSLNEANMVCREEHELRLAGIDTVLVPKLLLKLLDPHDVIYPHASPTFLVSAP